MSLLVACHLIIGLGLLFYTGANVIFTGGYNFFSFFMILFAIFYGFAPAVFHFANSIGLVHFWTPYIDYGKQPYDIALILIILAIIALRVGWICAGRFRVFRIHEAHELTTEREAVLLRRVLVLAWSMLLISIGLMYLHIRAYGGFLDALKVASAVRAGRIAISNPWAFLRPLGGFSLFASYLFFAVLFSRSGVRKRLSSSIGFLLAFLFSFYVLLNWGGRVWIAIYVITFIIAYYRMRHPRVLLRQLVLGLLMAVSLLYFGYPILFGLRGLLLTGSFSFSTQGTSLLGFILGELSFPIVAISTALDAVYDGIISMRCFVDIPLAFVHLLPAQWSVVPEVSLSMINTELIRGVSSVGGGFPVDIISLGVYSLGVWGVPIVAFGFGFIVRLLQAWISRIVVPNVSITLSVAIGLRIALVLAYADPKNALRNNLFLIVGLLITTAVTGYWSNRMKTQRRLPYEKEQQTWRVANL